MIRRRLMRLAAEGMLAVGTIGIMFVLAFAGMHAKLRGYAE